MTARRLYEVRLSMTKFLLSHIATHETIGFLVYFEGEVLKRAHKNFSFLNGR